MLLDFPRTSPKRGLDSGDFKKINLSVDRGVYWYKKTEIPKKVLLVFKK